MPSLNQRRKVVTAANSLEPEKSTGEAAILCALQVFIRNFTHADGGVHPSKHAYSSLFLGSLM